MKKNENPAYPRTYELWYTYSAGYNRELNQALNAALDRHGTIDAALLDRFYDEFVSPLNLSDRLGDVSDQMSVEINELIRRIEESTGTVGEYGKELSDAANTLSSDSSVEQTRSVVARVLTATRAMEDRNCNLEEQLRTSRQQIAELQDNLEAVRTETITDVLTGLANRRHFDQALERLISSERHEENPLCLIMCDIDHFKRFNDTYGHQTGDQVLKLVGATLKQSVKGRDVASRYGGEEFAIILPQTDYDSACVVAEQIRAAIMKKELVKRSTGENLGRITMSFGIAMMNVSDTPDSMISRADAALYKSKRNGRNRVTGEDALTDEDVQAVA
ncbi:GGDEF domain-containing protein [Tepidamorphus sp. 3E244]|uniref:GGDEF domain-containing protein n=1 Tax=Tepidamorphus sp. 3E244 TaxID=3385498 RepID=UPI0038FC5605